MNNPTILYLEKNSQLSAKQWERVFPEFSFLTPDTMMEAMSILKSQHIDLIISDEQILNHNLYFFPWH